MRINSETFFFTDVEKKDLTLWYICKKDVEKKEILIFNFKGLMIYFNFTLR
jgi:hypothetical protein